MVKVSEIPVDGDAEGGAGHSLLNGKTPAAPEDDTGNASSIYKRRMDKQDIERDEQKAGLINGRDMGAGDR